MASRSAERGETPLIGGTANRGLVVRVADTVRRPQSAASPAVHALLDHLEAAGFEGAPRHLGQDRAGREVLSYIEGDVPIPPTPAWALTDDALASVATLLRRYHDAAASFDPSPHRWATWVPEPYAGGLVTHNDPNLDNVVFRDGVAVALIDFDLASPGSAIWDLALAARLWVPLRDPHDVPGPLAAAAPERLRLLADAYGLTRAERGELVEATPLTHLWSYELVREGAERGEPGYVGYWKQGAIDRYTRTARWFEKNLRVLQRAVTRE